MENTHRQTDRQTERQTDRETDRQRDRQTDRQTDRETDRQTDRYVVRQTDRYVVKQTDKRLDRQDRQLCLILKSCFNLFIQEYKSDVQLTGLVNHAAHRDSAYLSFKPEDKLRNGKTSGKFEW